MDNENVNPTLGVVIPSPTGRKVAYAIYGLISFIVGNTVVFYAATQMDVPTWLIGAVAVVNNIAPVFGAVAIANAPTVAKKHVESVEPVEALPFTSVEVPFD